MFNLNRDDFSLKYANQTMASVYLLNTANLVFVGARGTGKTTELIAYRVADMCHEMQRFSIGYMADTYVNLQTNLVPTLMIGLERLGYCEGKDYVVGVEPPDSFEKPLLKSSRFKNTMTFWNGFKIFFISADRPSLSAGLSLAHIICEEAKFIRTNSFNRLIPVLRENPLIAPNETHYFQSWTIVTDMPNPKKKMEFDWCLSLDKEIDQGQNDLIMQCAFALNDLLTDYLKRGYTYDQIQADNSYKRWSNRLRKLRMNSNSFFRVSSYANADILQLKYFTNLWNALESTDFYSSVLSIKAKKGDGELYFSRFGLKNVFNDGYLYKGHYDEMGFSTSIKQTAAGLKYYRPNAPLYGGMDFGNMCSIVIGQDETSKFRLLKEFHTLNKENDPQYLPELARQVADFFKYSKNKELHLHYDRAGNNLGKHGSANQFKEYLEGFNEGWVVHLESIKKGTLYHSTMYDLMSKLFDKSCEVQIVIDEYNCRNLISSIELSPARINSQGYRVFDKRSENKRIDLLPSESTNYASALVYLLEGLYSSLMPIGNIYSPEAQT